MCGGGGGGEVPLDPPMSVLPHQGYGKGKSHGSYLSLCLK